MSENKGRASQLMEPIKNFFGLSRRSKQQPQAVDPVWPRPPQPDPAVEMVADEDKKPLFIPLKTEYFQAFQDGSKTEELRLYGPGWNEETCIVGRAVLLSKGYGKQERLQGRISGFRKQAARSLNPADRKAIRAIYETLDIEIACIAITGLEPVQE